MSNANRAYRNTPQLNTQVSLKSGDISGPSDKFVLRNVQLTGDIDSIKSSVASKMCDLYNSGYTLLHVVPVNSTEGLLIFVK